jgi:hypothetical protein
VTPLALSSTLVFGFALMLFREALTEAVNLEAIRSVLLDLSALTSEYVMYYGVFMVLVLPVGWVAWRLLQYLATQFEGKRFSDVQLVVDCWWLIVTADELVTHLATTYGLGGIVAGIAAFAAYRIGVALALAWLPDPHRDQPKRRLLLLRVFGYQARTETLFDRVAQQWRFHGPVQLIAGVDLAMRTVDPGDMLAFVGGRLDERYVASADEAGRHVSELDMERDPDGRFRVNEVYCRDDTWRPTLQALIDATDTVLMDLRSFSSVNAGCVFELEQLVSRLPPEKIVFVYDQTTDLRLLGNCLADGWQRAGRDGVPAWAPISCVRVERNSWSELQLLMRRLLGLEQPRRVLAVADDQIALAGWVLTDDPSISGATNNRMAPLTFIDAGGFVRFRADGETDHRPDHTFFRIDRFGETIRLLNPAARIIDTIDLAIQVDSVSEGRYPDGAPQIVRFYRSVSPAAPKYLPSGDADQDALDVGVKCRLDQFPDTERGRMQWVPKTLRDQP